MVLMRLLADNWPIVVVIFITGVVRYGLVEDEKE